VLARILGLKDKGRYEEAGKVIENSLLHFGLKTPEEYLNIEPAELLSELKTTYDLNDGQLNILAELLFQRGEIERGLSSADIDTKYYSRALIILEYLTDNENVYSLERGQRIEWIKSYLIN
jgi:hypothetical protein